MSYTRLNQKLVSESVTFATSQQTSGGATVGGKSYAIPTKAGYDIVSVTPTISGAGWGNFSAINGGGSIYFRNNSSSSYTVTIGAIVLYASQ